MESIVFIRFSAGGFGGVERQICLIADSLYQQKNFFPILLTSDDKSLLSKYFNDKGYPVYQVSMSFIRLFEVKKVFDLIVENHSIAILQSHMFRESFLGRYLKYLNRDMVHIFRVHTYIDCSWIPRWKKEIYHLMDKITEGLVDQYVGIGNYIEKELIERSWISKSKIKIVADAVSSMGEPDRWDNSSKLPRKVALVASLIPHKGHDVALKALQILNRREVSINLRIIGGSFASIESEFFERKLRADVVHFGLDKQIDFFGFTDNVYEALRGYPVVILPSDSEGLPNCILEAMALKKIVVASHVGGTPEIVINESNGFLHSIQDAEALANILERIFNVESGSLNVIRDRAYETWRKRFTLHQMMQGLLSIYRKLGALKDGC